VKKTKMSEYDSALRNGLIALNLAADDELVRVVQTTGEDDIVMVSGEGPGDQVRRVGVRRWGVRPPGCGHAPARGRHRGELRGGGAGCGHAVREQQWARQAHQARPVPLQNRGGQGCGG